MTSAKKAGRPICDIVVADKGSSDATEMQIKSAAAGLRMADVPVIYRQRIGRSKITRTTHGSLYAGTHILIIMARSALLPERATRKT
jgi:hypothetical protein